MKLILSTIIILISISQILHSSELICQKEKNFSNYGYYSHPKLIEINVNNSRKWNVNSRRLLLNIQKQNPTFTPDGLGKITNKYKKKFKATIKVTFEDENVCVFKGRIRQHGDMMDHIKLSDDGNLLQSINVALDSGNINGVTKFYLFLKQSRSNDEIFFTEFLRELKFLAPKTYKVEVNINGIKNNLLFQEKISKEFLESMKKREGPIFEGDETFRSQLKHEDNFLIAKTDLAKQTNAAWAMKSKVHKEISIQSYTKINNFFLSNNLAEIKNVDKISFPVVNLDSKYLAGGNLDQSKQIDKFNLMLMSVNGLHGLINNNRKFYWNSILHFFEPIYYDSDLHISELNFLDLKNVHYNIYNYPDHETISRYIKELEVDIKKIDFYLFYRNLKKLDNKITQSMVFQKKEQILKNLNNLNTNYPELSQNVSLEKNAKKNFVNEVLESYLYLRTSKNFSNHFLIYKNYNNNKFYNCSGNKISNDCIELVLDTNDEINLLKGPLLLEEKIYHYAGFFKGIDEKNHQNFIYSEERDASNKVNILDSIFYYDEGIDFNWDDKKLTLHITQIKNNARAYFVGGKLINIDINFKGVIPEKEESFNLLPFDRRGLTGCLSFINVTFSKVTIKSSATDCEDSLNLINTTGQIDEIQISNTSSDALDIDFSNLNINKIFINNAGNDCLDVSYGEYYFQNLIVKNCGDKGFSIGEKSLVKNDYLNVKNSNVGIASKDSSTTNLNNLEIRNVNTCLAAYNKKQEFFGSSINLKKLDCEYYINKTDIDQYSSITFN